MAKHTKPTPEELEESTEKALQEAEELKEKNEPEEEPEHEPEVEEKEEPEEDKETVSEADKDIEEIDYKKRFIESSSEAQVLHAKNKKINEAVENKRGTRSSRTKRSCQPSSATDRTATQASLSL